MMHCGTLERLIFFLLFGSKGFEQQTITGIDAYSAYQPSMNVNMNSSLSFQVKIDNLLGLILYAEDEKTNSFVSLTLLKSAKLRLDIGLFYYFLSSNISFPKLEPRTPDYLSCILDLSKVDGLIQEWHTIIINIYKYSITLQFNNINEKIFIPNSYQGMKRITGYIGSKMYFGGLPKKMKIDASRRVFFSSAIEPSFNGRISAVRIVRFISSLFLIPVLIEYESESQDICYFDSNFCRYCYSETKCSNYNYVTIDHNSEINYEFPIDFKSDFNRTISFQFRTKQDNSFLIYLGYFEESKLKPGQFLSAFIENGIFYTIISIPNTINPTFYSKKIYCESIYKQCADNKWHSVTVKHVKGEILITLDDKTVQFENFGQLNNIKTAELIIAKSSEPFEAYRNTYLRFQKPLSSFRGCMMKVYLDQNNVKLNIVEMIAKNVYNFKIKGTIYTNKCLDLFPQIPITFHSSSVHLHVPIPFSFQNGKVEISFKTLKENCILLYNPSNIQYYFHNIEIRESKLYLTVMYGSETYGEFLSQTNVSNGEVQLLEIFFQNGLITIENSGNKNIFNFSNSNNFVGMIGDLYIGSVPQPQILSLPLQIWSSWLREFFSGCIILLKINDESIQMDLLLDNNSFIKTGCHSLKEINDLNLCANKPCNDGVCSFDWDRAQCDCSDSNYTQPTCSKEATVAEFNGYQFMKITLRSQYQSEAEDISIRFKSKLPDGLILSTESQFSGTTDKLQIFMKKGNIYLLLNFGLGNKKFKTSENCFDGKWHNVKIKRRKKNLKIWIDKNFYQFNDFLNLEVPVIRITHIIVGSSFLNRTDFQSQIDVLSTDLIHLGKINKSKNEFFVGHMMHFIFNGISYFELPKDKTSNNIEVTASLTQASHIKQFPVYFQSVESYLMISKVNIFGDFRLEFLIKTTQASGLVLLLKGDSGDYLFLEMVDQMLHIVYNWGSGYKRKASENSFLNDNNWHSIKIVRHQSNTHSFAFRVDGYPEDERADVPVERGGLNFNHYGRMYLGGYKKNESIIMFDNEMPRSRNGFQGCIASFYVNNTMSLEEPIKYKDLLQDASEINGVQENCPYFTNSEDIQCFSDYCSFGGTCLQQWKNIHCDCTMTSFTGVKCQDVSTTVQFIKQPSYIIFKFITPRNNTIDKLSFGFQTNTVKDASLISIMGASLEEEFLNIQIRILEGSGFIEVIYNMGDSRFSLLESRLNVVDGLYHIIRFTRQGITATLQIDNLSQRIYVPDVKNGITEYIEHSLVILGSRVVGNKYSFQGYISGLNFNNIPLTDIVNNHIEPNTQLLNKTNIILVPSFLPRFNDRSSLSLRQSEEEVKSPKDNPSANRIVIAKLNCPGITEDEKYQCQFSNPKGLVKPGITYRKLENNKKEDEKSILQTFPTLTTRNSIDSEDRNPLSVSDINLYPNIKSPTKTNTNSIVNINLWLIVAFSSAGAFLLVALSCLIYRCSTKDEGSYNVEEDRVCIQTKDKITKFNLKTLKDDKTNEGLLTNGSKKNIKMKKRCTDTKEWYV